MIQRVKGKKEIPQDRAVSLFFNIAGILILIVEAYPLIYVLSASFSSSDAISLGKVYLWPVEFSLEGYKMLVQNSQILNGFRNSIIYMAAIMGINEELYDAAYVDGCGRFKRLIHVTLPGLLPTIVIMFIMRLGNIMTVGFEKVILLYNPLTYETADVISSYVYRRGILEANYSYAAAVGFFNSLINFGFLILANWLSKKATDESLW